MAKKFFMCVLFRDDETRIKESFSSKLSALEWFDNFVQENKRPVTITFYCGCTPYWVFRKE